MTLPKGSYTAFVGPSGSGKSTIARLIASLWDVDSGSIEIGGVNIKDLSLQLKFCSIFVQGIHIYKFLF